MTTPPSRVTTILVNNLHCPSCITNVEETLSALQPSPFSVTTSIISQEIKVAHPNTLSTSRILQSLSDAAFEIDSARTDEDEIEIHNEQFEIAHRAKPEYDAREQSSLHVSKCDVCFMELAKSKSTSTDVQSDTSITKISAPTENENNLTTVMTDSPDTSRVRMTLSINGMSCSSCVSKITDALQPIPWVQSVDVNLLTASAVVVLLDKAQVDNCLDIVKGAGYSAELIHTEDIHAKKPPKPMTDSWRASFIIGGMTCSSCVGKVTNSLEKYNWVTRVDVHLLSGSATIEFQGKNHLDEIATVINSLGYKATLSDVESRDPVGTQTSKRTVTLQIDGMHCAHCPQRVQNALATFADELEVTQLPTQSKPLLTVVYTPRVPRFTIRHIVNAISESDTAFTVSVYKPPSLEERSQAIRRKHQWQITRRLVLAVAAAIPTFVIGIVYMSLVPSDNPGKLYLGQPIWAGEASRLEWALFIIATPVYFFSADVFHRRMLAEIKALWRQGSTTPILRRFYRFGSMDMLMSLGTTVSYFASIAILAINATQPRDSNNTTHTDTFFDSVVFLTMFLLVGRLLEAYSKAKSGDAVSLLSKLRPTEAFLVEQEDSTGPFESRKVIAVPVDQLEVGDAVLVRNGASPPYDGILVNGESQFDESSLTGESKPVKKTVGEEVFSGTINKTDPILVRVARLSGDSMLDQVIGAVREGQTRRAPIERTADLITGYFVPVVTLLAILDWVIWLALGVSGQLPDSWREDGAGGWEFWALQFAISVFVVACPCGIGLAAPTALFVGGGLAAKHGILVKGGGEAFQEASQLDCIVFDKTGTITEGGEPSITDHDTSTTDPDQIEKLWGAVLALEQNSSHPIAKAVVNFATTHQPPDMSAVSITEVSGKGMKGLFQLPGNKKSVLDIAVGNESLMADHGIKLSPKQDHTLNDWKMQAKSVVLVGARFRASKSTEHSAPWSLAFMLAVADSIRPEAATTIKALQDRNIAVWMISGDNPTTARAVGRTVGIPSDNIIAGVLPEQKADKIQYLQKTLARAPRTGWLGSFGSGKTRTGRALVAMVGDGINDSPALTMADVGIAIGSGSDIAISAAAFVLVTSSLTSLLTLVDLSRVVFRRIRFNFGWALVYNCIAVPVAAGVFFPIVSNGTHIRLDPVWASLAMALSSLSVICSSLLMKTSLPLVGTRSVGAGQ